MASGRLSCLILFFSPAFIGLSLPITWFQCDSDLIPLLAVCSQCGVQPCALSHTAGDV